MIADVAAVILIWRLKTDHVSNTDEMNEGWITVVLRATDESSISGYNGNNVKTVEDFYYQWIVYQWIRHWFWVSVLVLAKWGISGWLSAVDSI